MGSAGQRHGIPRDVRRYRANTPTCIRDNVCVNRAESQNGDMRRLMCCARSREQKFRADRRKNRWWYDAIYTRRYCPDKAVRFCSGIRAVRQYGLYECPRPPRRIRLPAKKSGTCSSKDRTCGSITHAEECAKGEI